MNSPRDAMTAGDAPVRVGTLTQGAAWQALTKHHTKIGASHLRALFASDATRGERLVLGAAGCTLRCGHRRASRRGRAASTMLAIHDYPTAALEADRRTEGSLGTVHVL